MKHTLKALIATGILMTFSITANADSDNHHGKKKGEKAQASHEMSQSVDTSSPELKRIKSLAGRWTSTTSMFGKKNQRVYTEYQVTSGGSAVLERIFPGTPHEMVSVYYDNDKGKLTMTHYCLLKNRPTLTLASTTDDSMTLRVTKVEGLKSKKDPKMGDLKFTFKDKDHLAVSCSGQGEKAKPMTMEYTRVKK